MVRAMQAVLDALKREWPVIEGAPWSFGLCVALVAAVIWAFVHLLNKQAFKNKDTEISHKNAEIGLLKQQKDDAERKLALARVEGAGAPPSSGPLAVEGPTPVAVADKPPALPPAPAEPPPLDPRRLHVGRIAASTRYLSTGLRFDFSVHAFNGTGSVLEVCGILGRVAYGNADSEADQRPVDLVPLLELECFTDGDDWEPLAEITIVIHQSVRREDADAICALLSKPAGARFLLDDLRIVLRDGEQGRSVHMPVWSGVNYRHVKGPVVAGRIFNERLGDAARASDGT